MEPKRCTSCGTSNLKEYPFKCKTCSQLNYEPENKEVDTIIDNITKLDFISENNTFNEEEDN